MNAVVARIDPNVPAAAVADSVRRWKHLGALTQSEQETILSRSVIERARRQIGLFTSILLDRLDRHHRADHLHADDGQDEEIATLKLIGAPDRTIVGLIVQQSLAMGAHRLPVRRRS